MDSVASESSSQEGIDPCVSAHTNVPRLFNLKHSPILSRRQIRSRLKAFKVVGAGNHKSIIPCTNDELSNPHTQVVVLPAVEELINHKASDDQELDSLVGLYGVAYHAFKENLDESDRVS